MNFTNSAVTWNSLSDDIVGHISLFCDPQTQTSLATTSKKMREIIKYWNPKCWQQAVDRGVRCVIDLAPRPFFLDGSLIICITK